MVSQACEMLLNSSGQFTDIKITLTKNTWLMKIAG